MNNTLYEKLEQLSESKQMVSLYLDGDTETFYAGYILGINEDNILFQHITPYGKYDGYILQQTSNVCRVGYDELYLKKMECDAQKMQSIKILAEGCGEKKIDLET